LNKQLFTRDELRKPLYNSYRNYKFLTIYRHQHSTTHLKGVTPMTLWEKGSERPSE